MAPCITSTQDLYYLAEEFGGENPEDEGLISTIFVYVDAESHAYFGQIAKSKLLVTLEEFRTTLEPIPDEDIFPAVTDGTEAYEPPEGSNAIVNLYVKRPLLKAYHEYKQSDCLDMIAENLMDEIAALQHIAQHDPHPNIVRFYGCQINRGRITGIVLERHQNSLSDFLNLEKYALGMKEEKALRSNQQVPDPEHKSLSQEGQSPRLDEQAPTPEEQNPSEQTPGPQGKAVGPKEKALEEEELPPTEQVLEPDEQALGPEEQPQAEKPPHMEEQFPEGQAPDVEEAAPNRKVGLDKEAFPSGLESALSDLHRIGLAHNDVNPSKVMLHRETGAPVLIDFGSCRRIGERLGVTGGTDGWMEGDISECTHSKVSHDLYALAKMRVLLEEREAKL